MRQGDPDNDGLMREEEVERRLSDGDRGRDQQITDGLDDDVKPCAEALPKYETP